MTTNPLMPLALEMVRCILCFGAGVRCNADTKGLIIQCPGCKGIKKVPLFPGLREGCSWCHNNGYTYGHGRAGSPVTCGQCQGRCWVLADVDVGQLMKIARDAKFHLFLHTSLDGKFWAFTYLPGCGREQLINESSKHYDEPVDALVQSLYEIVEFKQEGRQ